jgi:hypothetical protein
MGEHASGCGVALYLDDIAKFMFDTDFHVGFDGMQHFRTYTVGFGRDPFGLALLEKTAVAGGGLFFLPGDADALADVIIAAGTPPVAVPAVGRGGWGAAALALVAAGWAALRRGAASRPPRG